MRFKRSFTLLILGLYLFAFLPNFVSARSSAEISQGISEVGSKIYEIIRAPLEAIIGESSNGEYFLAKVLLLLIIFILVFAAVEKMSLLNDQKWAIWLISIAVSILSIRFFGDSKLIETIILPYNAMGIAMTTILPFILYYFFTEGFSAPVRKIARLLFGFAFLGAWYLRRDTIGLFSFAGYVYLGTAAASIILFYFDGSFQRWKRKAAHEANRNVAEAKMRAKVVKMRNDLTDNLINVYGGNIRHPDYIALDNHISKLEKKYGIK